MKPRSIYLSKECELPDGINLAQERFCERWMSVDDAISAALDVRIRNAGWQFMWFGGTYRCRGFGRTEESAVSRATILALNQLQSYFNAAELDAVRVTKYFGFRVAKVSLHARRIQQQVGFSPG